MRNERPIPIEIRYVAYFFLLCGVLCTLPVVNSLFALLTNSTDSKLYHVTVMNLAFLYPTYFMFRCIYGLLSLNKDSYTTASNTLRFIIAWLCFGIYLVLMNAFDTFQVIQVSWKTSLLIAFGLAALTALSIQLLHVLKRDDISAMFENQSTELVQES